MIDSKCNRYALELIHNRKINISTQQPSIFSYIYQQIVNISRNAPVYLIYSSEETQEFATQIKELSIELECYIQNFYRDDAANPFRQLRLTPQPTEHLTVKLLKQPSEPIEYNIQINSVANGQHNMGTYTSKRICPFTDRLYTFTILADDQAYDFEVAVTNTSTNEDILQKIASLINRTTENLEAVLLYENSKVALSIQASANRQNKPAVFTIRDTAQGGLISYYNIDHIQSEAGQSNFVVNDEEVNSYGTAFVIDDTFEITLHRPCEQTIKINFELDSNIITNELFKLQATLNHLLLISHASKKHTLEREISQILLAHKTELAQVGIELNEDLLLTSNQEQLEASIQNHSVEALFSGEQTFAPELMQYTQDIILDPMKYVPNKIVSYKDHTKINYPNPYMTSMYSGFIFTSYC